MNYLIILSRCKYPIYKNWMVNERGNAAHKFKQDHNEIILAKLSKSFMRIIKRAQTGPSGAYGVNVADRHRATCCSPTKRWDPLRCWTATTTMANLRYVYPKGRVGISFTKPVNHYALRVLSP